MATYNGASYIKEQLQSILLQLSPLDEIVISDDSSVDNTVDIIKAFGDPRIKLIEGQLFKSPIFNIENAIKHATGEYIFLADQDDVWTKDKMEKTLQLLHKCDMVVHNCTIVNDALEVTNESFFNLNGSGKGLIKNLVKNSYLGCCMAFRREILDQALPFPKNIPMHDIWIGMIAELFYKSCFWDEPLVLYRRHGYNVSSSGGRSPYSIQEKFLFRWNLVRYIPRLLYRKVF